MDDVLTDVLQSDEFACQLHMRPSGGGEALGAWVAALHLAFSSAFHFRNQSLHIKPLIIFQHPCSQKKSCTAGVQKMYGQLLLKVAFMSFGALELHILQMHQPEESSSCWWKQNM
jgi:hypothetical protein